VNVVKKLIFPTLILLGIVIFIIFIINKSTNVLSVLIPLVLFAAGVLGGIIQSVLSNGLKKSKYLILAWSAPLIFMLIGPLVIKDVVEGAGTLVLITLFSWPIGFVLLVIASLKRT
jgi:hypothetical protein